MHLRDRHAFAAFLAAALMAFTLLLAACGSQPTDTRCDAITALMASCNPDSTSDDLRCSPGLLAHHDEIIAGGCESLAAVKADWINDPWEGCDEPCYAPSGLFNMFCAVDKGLPGREAKQCCEGNEDFWADRQTACMVLSSETPDLTGVWTGNWISDLSVFRGEVSFDVEQHGEHLKGTGTLTMNIGEPMAGRLSGSATGAFFEGQAVSVYGGVEQTWDFQLAILEIVENTATVRYRLTIGGALDDEGNMVLRRQPK